MTDVSHIGASIGSFIPTRAERGPHSPSGVETPLHQSPSHTPTNKLGGGDGGDGSTFLSGGGSTAPARSTVEPPKIGQDGIAPFGGDCATHQYDNRRIIVLS